QKKVFISFMTKDGKFHPPIGMSIIESGENRRYLANDSMSPFLGYIKKVEVDDITRVRGVKGVEKFYDYYLFATKDQILKGPRDIGNNIIIEKNSIKSIREDGYDAILNIPLKLQKEIELLLSKNALKYDTTEIVAAIMNSKTGEILTLATSMRYNPSNITRKDYDALNLTATEYPYEPGSVIKPIIFSIVYENNKVGLNDIINTHNGSYKLGSRIIKDTNPQKSLSATDVVVKSSNIGMIEITSKLDNIKLFEGLLKYNLSNKTGIDMPYEQAGNIPTLNMLQNTSNKATISYGYGLQATFMQILNAFAIYNNDGVMITPRVVKQLQKDGKIYNLNEPAIKEVISKKTADAIKHILIETVNKGTGRKAITKGLVVGGKTGTARIAQKGEYTRLYNSSFFGFANDSNVSYTIGVLVREPKKGSYYAAQNALPVFKEIIDLLIKDNYLKPFEDKNFEEIDHEILNSIKD
uniref:peptidoglycan D,D-transpeptidase FtsI family protein n=1 Tax=Campylobacter ureolyticus TaxID=827 RepID=UPI0026EA9366